MSITIIILLYLLNLVILKNLPIFVVDYYISKYGFYFIMIPFVVYYIIIKEEIIRKK